MAETEVESILREIREQVLAQQHSVQPGPTPLANAGNGNSESEAIARVGSNSCLEDDLALFKSHLTITARTWDRLPPLVSNRSGSSAKLELWLKRLLKRASRWFTWEQVNFNASVHHALEGLPALLSALEQEIARQRQQIKSLQDSQFVTTEQHRLDLQPLGELGTLRADLERQQRAIEEQTKQLEEQRIQMGARLADVVSELRDSVMHLQEEHRVSFKQLALESSEAATLEERGRRKTEILLEELQRRVDEMRNNDG